LLLFSGVAKFCYEEFKYPSEMSTPDFDRLPVKNNWTLEVKKSFSSILFGVHDPTVLFTHFVIGAVFQVEPYGQYGQLTMHLDTACAIINYALFFNRVVVPHHKIGWQHLC
jgi:hypothetical protein